MKTRHKTNDKVEILIAEDSPTQAAQLSYLLEQHDYKVTAAANGREALALMAQHKPALVISDIVMPELDGYGLCRAIKADEKLREIPVMLVTTLSDSEDVIRGLECGADNFLRKPYEERYLLSRVDYLLINSRLRKSQKMQMGMEIDLGGRKHFISSDRQQILDLLISTYEQAVEINSELAQREKELAHSNQVLQGLTRLAASLNGVTSEREVAETALRHALELPGVHAGWISLRTGENGFRLAATCSLPPALSDPEAFDGDCACRRQLLNGELAAGINIIKCDRLARAKGDTAGLCSHASVPLWLGDGRALGVMNLAGEGNSQFSVAELELLHGVGNQVAVALERARMHENLEMLVTERTAKLDAEIEERKRIERQHLRLVSIVEATPDFVGSADLAGRPVFINQAGMRMLGYEPGQGMPNGNIADMHPDWAAKRVLEEGIPHAMEHGSWSGETALLRRDGTVIPVSQVIIAQKEADGAVRMLSTIMRDISEHKRDEEALKRSQRLLNETGRLAAASGWELNVDTGELLWTDELYRFYEVDRNFKPTLDKALDFHAPSSRPLREQALRRAVEHGEPFDLELEVVTAKGNHRWIHSIGRADLEHRKLYGALVDITARKLSEIALHESRESLQRLLDSMFEAVYGVDIEGRCTFVNHSFLRMLGYQHVDEVLGQPIHALIHHSHADGRPYPGSECRMYRAFRANQAANVSDEVFWRRDGVAIPVEYWTHPIVADGEVTGAIATFIDITERKQAQAALQQLNETLEQKVAARTAELEQARADAEQANRAKSAFLATMSHEIRTPMNGVLGMLEVLEHGSLSEHQRDQVQTMRDSAVTLLALIDDILDFSKIEAGRIDLESTPLSVADLVEGLCTSQLSVARRRGVALRVFVDPDLPERVLGDDTRLRQILYNLVGNAIKFSAGNPARPGRVAVRATLAAQEPLRIVFTVEDNGIGMDQAAQARLFTPFTQAEASTTRRFGGTGLGLTICRRLANLMGGEIGVQSRPDAGSVFTVTLPVALAPEQPLREQPDLSGLVCCLLDDAELDAGALTRYLEHAGATVRHCAGVEEAEPCVTANAPAVLIHAGDESRRWRDGDLPAQLRRVRIGHGRRRRARLEAPDCVSLDGDALRRQAFLRAVAVAAGRASPEIFDERSTDTLPGESAPPPTVAQARAENRLILVAEDDSVNQKVVLQQLALLGYAAEIAGDGAEALARWEEGSFALLFTDLHMPQMDGYQLAAEIRRREGGGRRLPIIALTANALRDEAARARATGMDDYLTKPVALARLRAVLDAWLPQQQAVPDAASSRADTTAASCALDVAVLQRLVGDDPAILHDFLGDYARVAAQAATELRATAAAKDHAQLAAIAHKLKSSSRAVGALPLGDLCAELENAGKCNDGSVVARRMAQFEMMFAEVEKQLAAWLSGEKKT